MGAMASSAPSTEICRGVAPLAPPQVFDPDAFYLQQHNEPNLHLGAWFNLNARKTVMQLLRNFQDLSAFR